MTQYFQYVKIPAQDKPATIDQIRLLRDNNAFIKGQCRNIIFAAAWADGENSYNVLADGGTAPDVYYPRGLKGITVAFSIYNDSGSTYDADFTFSFLGSGLAGLSYTWTRTINTGLRHISHYIELDYGNTFDNDYKKGGLSFTCEDTAGYTGDTYIYHCAFWGVFDDASTINPQLYEPADANDLRIPASEINALATVPQFLGGWLSSAGDWITRDAGAVTPESFRLFHLLDYADDQISDDKYYRFEIAKKGTVTDAAETFNLTGYHVESTTSETKAVQVYDAEALRYGVGGSSLKGESWATNSAIFGDVWSTGGSGDRSYLLGAAFFAYDITPFADARMQGDHRTACDSDYFDAITGEVIDYDTINGIGRAQFNTFMRRAAQTQAMLFREGKSFNLTTSHVAFWYFQHYVGDDQVWYVNKQTKGKAMGHVCIMCNVPSGSGTIEIELSSDIAGDTDLMAFNYTAGDNYLSNTFEIAVNDDGGQLEQMSATIRDKNTSLTLTIYGVWIGFDSYLDTY